MFDEKIVERVCSQEEAAKLLEDMKKSFDSLHEDNQKGVLNTLRSL